MVDQLPTLVAAFPRGNSNAHVDDDHPYGLLGAASMYGRAYSSAGIEVRHLGRGRWGVDDADELTGKQAIKVLENLDAAGQLRAPRRARIAA